MCRFLEAALLEEVDVGLWGERGGKEGRLTPVEVTVAKACGLPIGD